MGTYSGEFKDGKKCGWGVVNDPDNNIRYEGYFKDDEFDGIGTKNV